MSVHARTVIRDAAVAQLVAAATIAGANVFPTRKSNITLEELPLICVYVLQDATTGGEETAPRELVREAPIHLEVWLGAGEDFDRIDAELDAFCKEVEGAMNAARYLGGCVDDSTYSETIINLDASGDQTMAMALITYQVQFRTLAPEPDVLEPFERTGTHYDIAGQQDEPDQAQDLIELPGAP